LGPGREPEPSLFAALDIAAGKVIGSLHHRQRHQEFLRFLDRIYQAVPETLKIHLVMDNYGTHKMPKVRRWFARRPRYPLHFTPSGASWLNQVERFFGLLTDRRIRRGTFGSVRELNPRFTTTWRIATRMPGPSPGRPTPTRSSKRSLAFACGLLTHDSSVGFAGFRWPPCLRL
jgi:transposase